MSNIPLIPGYELYERVGSGQMGVVYRAIQATLDREVAVKVIHPRLSVRPDVGARFQEEARHVARLNHPHIVLGIDTGVVEGNHFFVMEFLHGGTLLQRMKKDGPLPEKEVLVYLEQMAGALQHAEGFQLIHRDLKPDNMMLDAYGKLKLMDLGLAMITTGEEEDSTKIVRGTPHYISPEQLKRLHPLDSRCDIYSLGATFYHLLCGVTPFSGEDGRAIALARLKNPPPDIRRVRADVSRGTAELLLRMMATAREDRPASPGELQEDCRKLLAKPKKRSGDSLRRLLSSAKEQSSPAEQGRGKISLLKKLSSGISRVIRRK